MSYFVELHVLHTTPPSNPNRDKDGNVKNAIVGGVRRAILSSQSQKRAARENYRERIADRNQLASRSRYHWHELSEHLANLKIDNPKIAAQLILAAFNLNDGSKLFPSLLDPENNLLFLSSHELELIAKIFGKDDLLSDLVVRGAEFLQESKDKAFKPKNFHSHANKKDLTAIQKKLRSLDAIPGEVALFGRMMASHDETTVDGSVCVASAIGVTELPTPRSDNGWGAGEIDFFAAVDDVAPSEGAGMIGKTRFTSTTYYRYANVNVSHFRELMGGDHDEMIEAFLRSFALSLPTGFKTRFSHATMPDFILLQVRETSPYNYAPAFQSVISAAPHQTIAAQAMNTMMGYRQSVMDVYGDEVLCERVVAIDEPSIGQFRSSVSLSDAIADVMAATAVAG